VSSAPVLVRPCGWFKDKYGLSWQVVPEGADVLFRDPDTSRAA
jgi:predicted 3-demethylubiquinone-9 3-methyltransferase (glyoxalase superfamily)